MSAPAAGASRTLPALIALGILNHSVLTGSRITVSLYALSLGGSPFVVGTLMGLYSFLPMWLAVGAGRLSDRIGVRGPMLAGSLGLGLGAVLPRLFPGLPALFGATALIGLSFMAFQVAAQNATGALSPPAERARNFALLALGYSVSGFSGPLLAGVLIDQASFGTTFLVLSLLPLIPVAVLARGALALPELPPQARPAPGRISELLRDGRLRRVFAINGLLSMSWDLHSFFVPVYGAKIGLSASRIGVILAAFAAATFVVRLLTPWIMRQLSELEVLIAALFVAGGAYALYPFVASLWPLLALSFTLGFALGSGQPMVMSLLLALTPPGRTGEAMGVRMSIINASTFAVPLASGAVGASLGIGPVFWLVGAALAGSGLLARRGR